MSQVDRFSVSLDTELLAAFDRHICERGYRNRSEAVRDMIRDMLVGTRLERGDSEVSSFLTVACDHREGEASRRLRKDLGQHPEIVVGSLAVPIDEHRDHLAIALTGSVDSVQALANKIGSMRGITHSHLSAVPIKE